MPIFEYRCHSCNATFEQFSTGGCSEAPACPQCGKTKTEKVFSVFSSQCGSSGSSTPAPSGGCGSGGFS